MSTETPPARKSSRLLLITALILSMAITAGSLFFILDRIINPGNTTSTGAAIVDSGDFFDGSTAIDPPREIGDFTLTGNDGQPLSLSDLRGKVTLLYFGYTHCPDVCPTTLNELRQVKRDLGSDADKINVLMISVDGARDTPAVMKDYLAGFDPGFLGMTGNDEEVRGAGVDFGLYFQTSEGDNYTLDHTATVFMLDRDGLLRTTFAYGTETEVITSNAQDLLNQ